MPSLFFIGACLVTTKALENAFSIATEFKVTFLTAKAGAISHSLSKIPIYRGRSEAEIPFRGAAGSINWLYLGNKGMVTAEGLLKKFTTAKTLPHIAIRLTKLISDENTTMRDFDKMIKMDPTLVLRILRVANSPYYGLRQKVNSISRAVVIIGINNLRNMIVTEALKDIFKESESKDTFSRNRLWLHCAAVSICSQMIMERIFCQNGENVFLCGILHDIGMIVEDQTAHDLFTQVCKAYNNSRKITDYEKEIIGTDHCEIGYLLAKDWLLPVEVQEGIQLHHNMIEDVSPLSITGVIQMAEYIVSQLDYTPISGMNALLSLPLASHIRENIKEYKTIVRDLPDEMSKAKDLYSPHEE